MEQPMIQSIISWRLSAAERQLGGSLDYVRHMVRVSLRCFFKFTKFLAVAEYRRKLPVDACHVARLVATRDADCGTCLQIEVNLARHAGLSTSSIESVLASAPDALPEALRDVYAFAEGVVTASGKEEAHRAGLVERYGEEALVELALAMAACRVFPIVKRTLGYATKCEAVEIHVD